MCNFTHCPPPIQFLFDENVPITSMTCVWNRQDCSDDRRIAREASTLRFMGPVIVTTHNRKARSNANRCTRVNNITKTRLKQQVQHNESYDNITT